MAVAGISAMVAGALRDRAVGVGVVLAAGLILLTAWILGVAAVVVLVAQKLGTAGALLAVTAGLVLFALVLVWLTQARNRTYAAQRATTRALWMATAVNAASTVLRGQIRPDARTGSRTDARPEPGPEPGSESAEAAPGNHRSLLLVAGGLVLILLAFLVPSGKTDGPSDKDTRTDNPEAGPDQTA